ncbi:hypothetical protein [Aliikangiella sp. IMCC44359]|uniref:hypothetical protein n=1 Tax=Aliikangiella sp. IMCC44359 TaxID=3459125 RepID=UPI00403B296D
MFLYSTSKKHFKWLVFLTILLVPSYLLADESLSGFVIKTVEPLEQRVVIKNPSGEMKVYQNGEKLDKTGAVILEILTDKVVLEESVKTFNGTVEKQKILMGIEKNGRSAINRLYIVEQSAAQLLPVNNAKNKSIKN